MSYTIESALPADAAAIARVATADEPTPFRRLMNGTAGDNDNMLQEETAMWAKVIDHPAHLVLVAREQDTGLVVSYAQWRRPGGEEPLHPSPDLATEEEKAKLRDRRLASLPAGMNGPLVLAFSEHVAALGRQGFQGRRRWYLNALGTLVTHRGRGLATQLVRWPFAEADREGIIVGLFTDGEGRARALYQRLGFRETARFVLELGAFGGGAEDRHVELAMVREPGASEEGRDGG
ncbi:hypothetical protein JX266_005325 [Neoarthrinium moseri]|nr:hypothetical protein JX266_005325 [Neoarthrinium moseri]